ncbi:protein THALLO [Nymphaea colorata]|nr:protein THALLO [Nymphaea colorata]
MGRGKKPKKSMNTAKKKGNRDSKPRSIERFGEEDMDDEIDAFHKQQDVIPLDVDRHADLSDEDIEEPVFDVEADDDDDDDEEEEEEEGDDSELSGLAAKIVRQKKYLRAKMGGVEDEMDEEDQPDEDEDAGWGQSKRAYYNADNIHETQSSDDELALEEEAEVIRLQKERAKSLQMEDFGLDEDAEEMMISMSAGEPKMTVEKKSKKLADVVEDADDESEIYKVERDINSLSKEEQMEVVFSAAPELVGLLSELNLSLDQLGGELGPLDAKKNGKDSTTNGRMHYLEVKRLLLLNYCQAIVFYLLLKSEGHPIRDHPVLARLVEIKSLLDKVSQICPTTHQAVVETLDNDGEYGGQDKTNTVDYIMQHENHKRSLSNDQLKSCESTQLYESNGDVVLDMTKPLDTKDELEKVGALGQESMEMLKVRASLEEKLKQKGIYKSAIPEKASKAKNSRLSRRKHDTLDDFDDEDGPKSVSTTIASDKHVIKLSQLVTMAGKAVKRPKLVSGDADLPKREDIGERRRKHDLQSLAKPQEDLVADVEDDTNASDFEDEFYKEVKQSRAAKVAAKAEVYTRSTILQSSSEPEAHGKRQITYQMETNKGLTRKRKKLTKIPRKKYKLKHQKAVVHRKGQVRDLRRPSGPYGGEEAGINTRVSHSVRFRN